MRRSAGVVRTSEGWSMVMVRLREGFKGGSRCFGTGAFLGGRAAQMMQPIKRWTGLTGRRLVEKLAREFTRGLASLKDFFFRLILELCVLLPGKIVFSRGDADLL
jgi:hypothetical protein